jgi:hypothetical protein
MRDIGMKVLMPAFYSLVLPVLILAQGSPVSKLTGTVYDPQGSVIVGARVTAVAANGNKVSVVTNGEGVYQLSLSYARYFSGGQFKETKYDLIVESLGFQRSEIKGYVFIPSRFGKMILDIGLEVGPCSGCHSIELVPAKTKGKPR